MQINLFRPLVREEAVEAAATVLRSGWIGMGARTCEFERALAARLHAPHCVAVNNCSSALHLALRVLDLPAGAEVVTTAVTFISTNLGIVYERLRPVFADVNPRTGNLDPADVAARLTPATRALVLVHYGGTPCDLDEIYDLARRHQLTVVEDCAHALGASYKGRPIGSHDSLQAFSFDPTKNLTAGEGGALTFRCPDYETRLRRLRYLGMDRDNYERFSRSRSDGRAWHYGVSEVGFRYHLSDLHAAIGLAQLPFLEEDNRRRAAIAARYRAGLAGVAGLTLLEQPADRVSAHFLFCVLAERREALLAALAAHGVGASVHFPRNDEYPMFRRQELPQTEYFTSHVVSLPMHPGLTDAEVDYVLEVIREGW